jgi:RNA polymerase sigma-B factor
MADVMHQAAPRSRGPLRAAEERHLLERVHLHGDHGARDELVERMLPFVRRIARGYADRGELFEDLVQVGAIGLVNAIDRFDLDRGLRLSTFAAPNISGEIKRHFRDRAWSVRTPRDLQELYASLRAEGERFVREHGRSPTIAELVALTGRDEEHVLEALSAGRNFRAASLDAPPDDGGGTLGDALGRDDAGFDRAEDRAMVARGLRALGERERRIILLRYAQGLSQREIAAMVGISQMHVSRLLRRSIDELRDSVV